MAYSHFEDTLRKIIQLILICYPEKMDLKSCTITKEQICQIADKGHKVIIDNEIYQLFRNGVNKQVEDIFRMISNKKARNFEESLKDIIETCSQISIIRNALIHNAGKVSKKMLRNDNLYHTVNGNNIFLHEENVINSFNGFRLLMNELKIEIECTYKYYCRLPRVERIKLVWDRCFNSPIMNFYDYWDIDSDNDVIKGIVFPQHENSICSSEKVLLSIWRHQYDSKEPTEEFLLCSVHHESLATLYKELYDIEFYYMKQIAERI
ncbi:MAG: hypothetical protein PHV53_10405 [Fermentimonas sp.]|nr:hypothetical protein [Fermentimonas sp.]